MSIMFKTNQNGYLMINLCIAAKLATEHRRDNHWFELVQQGVDPIFAFYLTMFFEKDGTTVVYNPGHMAISGYFQNCNITRLISKTPNLENLKGAYNKGCGSSVV